MKLSRSGKEVLCLLSALALSGNRPLDRAPARKQRRGSIESPRLCRRIFSWLQFETLRSFRRLAFPQRFSPQRTSFKKFSGVRYLALAVIGVFSLSWSVGAEASETLVDLQPQESMLRSVFRSSAGEAREFLRLKRGDRATFLVCGAGKVEIQSRAFLRQKARAARYSLSVSLDGAPKLEELAYRVTPIATGFFDGSGRSGGLRRRSLSLSRGCHTVVIKVVSSTVGTIGLRTTFREERPRLRSWSQPAVAGGLFTQVLGRDSRANYRRLEPGEALRLSVEGPVWVRLLVREIGMAGESPTELVVRRGKKTLYRYSLIGAPSRSSRMAGEEETPIGRALEVAFPILVGKQSLSIGTTTPVPLLLRAEVAKASQHAPKSKERQPFRIQARLGGYYDSNILRYSDKFLDRFEAGQDPDRFRVRSLDDVVLRTDFSVDRVFRGWGRREARFGLGVEHRAYQRNSIKDWSRVALSLSQDLRRGRRIEARLTLTPDFYVRHLRDSDLTGSGSSVDPFQAFEFEKAESRFTFSQPLGASFAGQYFVGYSRFRHSRAFREFDSGNLAAGLRFDQLLARWLRLSYGTDFTDSRARGYDQAGETRGTSDDTDPSYRQLSLMVAARVRFPTSRRQTLFLQAEWEQREYTTGRGSVVAPLHFGREDDFFRLYGSWDLELSRRYRFTVFAQSRERSSSAPVVLDIGVEKDYSQFEVGLRLTARFGG